MLSTTELRAMFASRMSRMYALEVPAYQTLLDVCHEINTEVLAATGSAAERLGSAHRVTAERHGAIRVGTAGELAQAGQIFAAFGMYPVGFYDLRDAAPTPVPVVSTAFRPIDAAELAANPFRVFVSVLAHDDSRFFDARLQEQLLEFLRRRTLFPRELLELAERAEADGGLPDADGDRLVELACASFALSPEPVDAQWYRRLEAISTVAADIGGVNSTHINHLTPRVLDIDELYRRMQQRGIEMISQIQGPPRWDGPEVLLRQTSFRALSEPRRLRLADGSVVDGALRVRFGEVEARGIALTKLGRERYEQLSARIADRVRAEVASDGQAVAAEVWRDGFPRSELELALQGLAHFTYRPRQRDGQPPADPAELLRQGWLELQPIVYEDFLPRSAAGIFQSNLTGAGSADMDRAGSARDREWLAGVLGRQVHEPDDLYAQVSASSWAAAVAALGLAAIPRPSTG